MVVKIEISYITSKKEIPCDIYDAVIAKTSTSGDRKISGLLQSANRRPRKMSEHL